MGRGSRKAVQEKSSKYRNVKVQIDGHTFDSKREAAIYQDLKARQAAGEVRDIRLQVAWPLYCPEQNPSVPVGAVNTPAIQVAEYIADFVFYERDDAAQCWRRVVADAKGGRNTQMFQLKKKWLFLQSGIEIRELR